MYSVDDALRKEVMTLTTAHPSRDYRKDEDYMSKESLVLDIPLPFEMNYESLCDDIIVVAVSWCTHGKRNAGYTRQEALERIQSQMP